MGQVQNGHLPIRYSSSSKKNNAEKFKGVHTISLCCSIAKSTLYISSTNLWQGRENQHWKFQFRSSSFFLLLLFLHTKFKNDMVYVNIMYIPNDYSANGDHFYQFKAAGELQLESFASPGYFTLSFGHSSGYSCNNCVARKVHVYIVRPYSDYWIRALQASMSLPGTNCA